jgi:alpha-galactosidase
MTVEETALHLVRVTGGYNPFDFHWVLKAGDKLETPKFYVGYTDRGNGEASRIEHRFQTDEILPMRTATTPPKPRPIIFNSWEANGDDLYRPDTDRSCGESGQARSRAICD